LLSEGKRLSCLILLRKEKFFDLFKESAQNALSGAKALKEMLERYENPSACPQPAGNSSPDLWTAADFFRCFHGF
jgi:hypothetical protein